MAYGWYFPHHPTDSLYCMLIRLIKDNEFAIIHRLVSVMFTINYLNGPFILLRTSSAAFDTPGIYIPAKNTMSAGFEIGEGKISDADKEVDDGCIYVV